LRKVVLPGSINIQAFFPHIASSEDGSFEAISRANVCSGFTLACNSPTGLTESIQDKRTMSIA
jgi:carbamoyl-phosphate synthase/aspartate carbamoyltransferase